MHQDVERAEADGARGEHDAGKREQRDPGHPHATVWRALRRAGISRPPRQPREQPRRYEWPCPGDLLHIDSKRFVRFTRPGHAVTGDRHRSGAERRMRVGYEWVHSLVDDHSRLAYSELHRDEKAATVTGRLRAAWAEGDHGRAFDRLQTLAGELERTHPGAAGSLREGLEETLTL
ncbi:MAG TPA: hypothetical protein VIM33_00295, partial [Gaiellaceae bacterium]